MSYTRIWNCETCGQREETIDWPENQLGDRCDDRTKLRCVACGQRTTVTPRVLRASHARYAAHPGCVVVGDPRP